LKRMNLSWHHGDEIFGTIEALVLPCLCVEDNLQVA